MVRQKAARLLIAFTQVGALLGRIFPAGAALVLTLGSPALLVGAAEPPPVLAAPSFSGPVVPEKEISQQQGAVPRWKTQWAQAREAGRAGELVLAARLYEDLLSRKGNLEEARWELARVYLRLERQKEAADQLELLLEAEPDQTDYLIGLAAIMEEKNHFSRAAGLYSRVLRQQPENRPALAGMVRSLVRLDREEEALSHLETLYRQAPGDKAIRRDLVRLAIKTGHLEKARTHLVELAEPPSAQTEILLLAARVHEQLELTNLAILYRQRILAREPTDAESHQRLAAYFERQGRIKEALEHLRALLQQRPEDPALLQAIGRLLENGGRFAEALPYFEQYIAQRPHDKEALDSVVNIHTALGEEAKTLLSLERLLEVDPEPESAKLEKAARLYDAAGRHRQAVPLYRRLLARDPGNTEILAALATDLQRLGEDRGALSVWQQLARQQPENLQAHRAIADLLERFGRRAELFGILRKIQALDPTDQEALLKLAALHLQQREFDQAEDYLGLVSPKTRITAPFLEIQGLLLEELHRDSQALVSYQDLLDLVPTREDIHLRCIRISGRLGRLKVVRHHFEAWRQLNSRPGAGDLLTLAAAYRGSGAYDEALGLYEELLRSGENFPESFRRQARMDLATLYEEAGLLYEAEQALRQALLSGQEEEEVLQRLFDLALVDQRPGDALVWLRRLTELVRDDERGQAALRLRQARLLLAEGEYRAAISLSRKLLEEQPVFGPQAEELDQAFRTEIGTDLIRHLLAAGRFMTAREESLAQLRTAAPFFQLDFLVLLQQAHELAGRPEEARAVAARARSLAEEDGFLLVRLAELYQRENHPAEAVQAATAAARRIPDSLAARFLLARGHEQSGEMKKALEVVGRIAAEYPDNGRAAAWEAELLFQTGRFEEASRKAKEVLAASPWRVDLRLLQARLLWAGNQEKEALRVYREILQPPVEKVFAERTKKAGVAYQPHPPERPVWDRFTFQGGKETGFLDRVMAASHAVEGGGKHQRDLNAIAAPLYAPYRWQKRFAAELEAKRSVQRREYQHALKQYGAVLRDYQEDPFLLFDLAGVHSRLGNLGEEAVLYTRLGELNQDFPGLRQAEHRNRLKRQPHLDLAYRYLKEQGRDGYKALRTSQGQIGLWYSPLVQHQLNAETSRLNYRSTETGEDIWSHRGLISYQVDFRNSWWVRLGGGLEEPNNGYPVTGLVDCAMGAEIGDLLSTRFSFSRDLTKDTLASLTRTVVREDYRAALQMDLLPRVQVGGGYDYTDFSDDNAREGYDLWASWILMTEPTWLTLSYTYDYKDSREGRRPGPPLADGFAADDHPYWAPVNYWVNEFSLDFKHLLSEETFGRAIPRYYTVEYSLGHDSDGYAIQTLAGGLFVEWTPHLIMEATIGATTSDSYRAKEVSVSGVYRW